MSAFASLVAAVVLMLLLGLALGFVIGVAVKVLAVPQDPRVEQAEALLPGANCGACGFAGCADFARALAAGDAKPEQCPSSSDETIEQLAALLGLEVGERVQKVAVVRCGGDDTKATFAAAYNGVNDCRSAALAAGGAKGCLYGCLGLGTCARACPFGAIEITEHRLAVVHPDICTGCGKCVEACPRDLIALVPKSAPLHVLCNSPEKGAAKTKVCKAACIGCRKCVKNSEEGQMLIDGFLARVNYENPPGAELAEVCPTKCLRPATRPAESVPPTEDEKREVVNA